MSHDFLRSYAHSRNPSLEKRHMMTDVMRICFHLSLQKLWFQHVWPTLEGEVRSQEVLAAVLEPVLFLVKECTHEEYRQLIFPALRPVFGNPGKSIQAS